MKHSPSAMTRRSHAQANSAPRPRAEPLSAATKMTPLAFIRKNVACRRSSWTAPRSGVLRTTGSGTRAVTPRATRGNGGGAAPAQLRDRSTLFLQPPHVGVADGPAGTRPGEHHGMDAWIAVDAVHQLVELVGDVEAEQAVRAAVYPHDQDRSAVLDLEVALVLVCHGFAFVGVVSCPASWRTTSVECDHDLSVGLAVFDVRHRLQGLVEVEGPVQHGPQRAVVVQGCQGLQLCAIGVHEEEGVARPELPGALRTLRLSVAMTGARIGWPAAWRRPGRVGRRR